MSSVASLASDYLPGLGLMPGMLGGLTRNLRGADILSIALRIALIGICTALVRSGYSIIKAHLTDYIFPSAHIESIDPAFNWVLIYLAQDPGVQAQLKTYRLTAADSRKTKRDQLAKGNSRVIYANKKKEYVVHKSQASFATDDIIAQKAPPNERHIKVDFMGKTLWVYRSHQGFANSTSSARIDHLRVTGLFFQPESIKEFILAAHQVFFKKADSEILIFHPAPARTWRSVILPGTTEDELLEDVRGFLSDEEKEWYAARGIPHRRGYLLHGRPGAGKTTLATAIASELKLDIYVINPSARGYMLCRNIANARMNDAKLNKLFRTCPSGNMILIEDIDCVMPPRSKTKGHAEEDDDDDDDDSSDGDKEEKDVDPGRYGHAKSTVTLSGLLNAIDGVSSQEDCVLFASTNHPEHLDEALMRPGRFDVHAEFFDSNYAQALALFKHFYPVVEPIDVDAKTESEKSQAIIEFHARNFADKVFGINQPLPDGSTLTLSMTALQGFLLKYKKNPGKAAEEADKWVQDLWAGQAKKMEEKIERIKARRARKLAEAEEKAGYAVLNKEHAEVSSSTLPSTELVSAKA